MLRRLSTTRRTAPCPRGLATYLLRQGEGDHGVAEREAEQLVAAGGDRSAAAEAQGQAIGIAQRLGSPPLQLRAIIQGIELGLDGEVAGGIGSRAELTRLIAIYRGQADFPDLVIGRQLLDASG